MNIAQQQALLSRIEDRTFEVRHVERLLASAEDFLDNEIVLPAGDNGNDDRERAVEMRDRAVAFVVACRLSLFTIRADLTSIVDTHLYGRPEKGR